MILWVLEGKNFHSVLILRLWLPLEPRLHLDGDCHGIFHNFKMKYLQNYKRYLQVDDGNNFSTYFDCYPRILLSQKMWRGHAHDSLSFRGKELTLSFDTSVVTSFEASFAFQKVTVMVSSITLKWNISRTIRGICKWSTAFVSFSLAVSPQINLLFGWTFLLTVACQSFCLQSDPSSSRI